ncbi:polyketide cyclase [Marinomonas sp. SBI22]|uniref:nuclear transport factor 2 family protein n=1 Tax=unclassified Marinomonas TaxID=196814 RepID=UPI0007AF65A0|nr:MULTISPECIES: nuclear transport factor 2 family protein [unclassified Marinomonas]KZM38643.1 polyketide cyclase [Marinomonas sp. SBI22]KZM39187.1 polyketide cyclase [Marinomonas sp. SBI8L]
MLKITVFLSLLLIASVTLADSSNQNSDTLVIDFKSLQKENWTNEERQNAKLVTDFVQNLMNNHDFDYVLKNYNDSAYVQHNRNLPDKVQGLVGFLKDFVEDYPDYTYDVKHIYVDGNYVIFHSHATLEKEDRGNDQKGMNIIDTWRLDQGRIVEHWDSIQALDSFMRLYALMVGGNIENTNGVF